MTHTAGEVTINAGVGDRSSTAYNTNGSFTANLGDSSNVIRLGKTEGDVCTVSGNGSHSYDFLDTVGLLDLDVGEGTLFTHLFNMMHTIVD